MGAAPRRGGRRGGRQLLGLADGGRRAARRGRGQSRGPAIPPRHRRQPELLHHADGGRAEAAPGCSRGGPRGDLDLPVGLGHRAAGGERAGRPGARDAPRDGAARSRGLSASDRQQRASSGRELSRGRRLHD